MKTTFSFRWIVNAAVAAGLAAQVQPMAAANKANSPSAAVPSAELQEVAIPQSIFRIPKSPKEGRDPFFPDSLRVFGTTTTRTTNAAPTVVNYTLKGLAGAVDARFATIGTTGPGGSALSVDLAAGEEREIVTSTGRVKVRCLEIREDAVVIEAGGMRRELRLRAGQ